MAAAATTAHTAQIAVTTAAVRRKLPGVERGDRAARSRCGVEATGAKGVLVGAAFVRCTDPSSAWKDAAYERRSHTVRSPIVSDRGRILLTGWGRTSPSSSEV